MTLAITPRTVAILAAGIAATTLGFALRHDEPRVDLVLPGPWQPPVLELAGNHVFSSAQVRAGIPPLVDQDAIERAMLLVAAYYWDRGYPNAAFGTPTVTETAVVLPVDAGARFTMGTIAAPDASRLQVRPGMVFSRSMIAADREALQTFYEDQGFACASVTPVAKVDLDTHQIALTFELERGPRATFERIDVVGSSRREAEIRRALAIAAGQPYSATRLRTSKLRVLGLGFSSVELSTKRGSREDRVIATIEVSE